MSTIFHATFDGKVLHPEEPLGLKANTRYMVVIKGEDEEGDLEAGSEEEYPLTAIRSLAKDTGVDDLAESDSKDEAAFKWINEHGGQYTGQWLALDGDRLLAHGPDLSEVAAVARARGVQFPLLHLVEPPRDHPYIRS